MNSETPSILELIVGSLVLLLLTAWLIGGAGHRGRARVRPCKATVKLILTYHTCVNARPEMTLDTDDVAPGWKVPVRELFG